MKFLHLIYSLIFESFFCYFLSTLLKSYSKVDKSVSGNISEGCSSVAVNNQVWFPFKSQMYMNQALNIPSSSTDQMN